MERCPADIHRIILGYVCLHGEEERVCELRQMVRVNHMCRKWAISYILFHFKRNDKILERISKYYSILEQDAIDFKIIGYLRDDQWKHQQGMFVSFIMFLDAISLPRIISPPEVLLYGNANNMFTIDNGLF